MFTFLLKLFHPLAKSMMFYRFEAASRRPDGPAATALIDRVLLLTVKKRANVDPLESLTCSDALHRRHLIMAYSPVQHDFIGNSFML